MTRILVRHKYFVLAVVAVIVSLIAGVDRMPGTACGFAVAAGLCVVAAAIVEAKKNNGDKSA